MAAMAWNQCWKTTWRKTPPANGIIREASNGTVTSLSTIGVPTKTLTIHSAGTTNTIARPRYAFQSSPSMNRSRSGATATRMRINETTGEKSKTNVPQLGTSPAANHWNGEAKRT